MKNCAPFTDCISEINNIQIDNAKDIDVLMPMYNLIEYSNNYSKTSRSLWQYYRDEPNSNLTDSQSFKSKIKITGNIPANGNTRDVEIAVTLKYLSNFWRALEIPLINCETNLILTWSSTCVITNFTGAGRFAITYTKLYVPTATLSIQDNEKLLQQLKFDFKKTVNWNKYLSKVILYDTRKPYLDYLIGPSFQRVNSFFVLSFENNADRTARRGYYLQKVEIKDHNVKIDGRNFSDQPINNDIKTYENIRKFATGPWDDYATGCLLDYRYFKENYKTIAIDLSKQQAVDADPRAINNFIIWEIEIKQQVHLCFNSWRSKRNCLRLFTKNFESIGNVLYNNLI